MCIFPFANNCAHSAYVIAKLIIVVVLPSPGPGLDTIILPCVPFSVYIKLVRKLRYASEIGEVGSSCVINLLSKLMIPLPFLMAILLIKYLFQNLH